VKKGRDSRRGFLPFCNWLDEFPYQVPESFWTTSETPATDTQQQRPVRMGLKPFVRSLGRFVFRPIAAMAMTIMNFPAATRAPERSGTPQKVLTTEAATKPRTNQGNIFRTWNALPHFGPSLISVFAAV